MPLALLITALLSGRAVIAAPDNPPTDEPMLMNEWRSSLDHRDWSAAARLGEEAARRHPDQRGIHYNLACAYAHLGEIDQGINALRRSAECGFSLMTTFATDEDLDPLRRHSGYRDVLALVRRNHLTEFEKFKSRADRSARVLTFLPRRLDRARPAPLIVALHGYGGTADQMVEPWRRVADRLDAILICPQGMLPVGGGFSWGKVEDGEYLVLRAIEQTRRAQPVDKERVVLTGFSQGGSQTFITGMRHPELFAGAIPVVGHYAERVAPILPPAEAAGYLPYPRVPIADSAAGSDVDLHRDDGAETSGRADAAAPREPHHTRWVLMCGEGDEEAANNRDAADLLKKTGYPALLRIYPGGHTFPPDREAALRGAVEFVLNGR